jgi:hypothetical protein
MTLLHDHVAQVALDHFTKDLPNKGKPKENEWTVYAAIVASQQLHASAETSIEAWVVSSATGTKCTSERCDGCILHDAHAEVLARRGLVRVLWKELLAARQGLVPTSRSLLEVYASDGTNSSGNAPPLQFQLRKQVQLHLYVSDSPCGDASIYPLGDNNALQFTGAKVIVSTETDVSVEACGGSHQIVQVMADQQKSLAREDTQLLGKLRSKSGRSNLTQQRSSSMSCSDKLVRWGVLGLQGHVLSAYIPIPIRLASLVVSRDPRLPNQQAQALQRAVPDRIHAVAAQHITPGTSSSAKEGEDGACGFWYGTSITPPTVCICDRVFARGKSVVESQGITKEAPTKAAPPQPPPRKRQKQDTKAASSCGMSIHWQQSDPTVELVVGARGIRQGKKPKSNPQICALHSRLSRAALVQLARDSGVVGGINGNDEMTTKTYQEWKKQVGSSRYFKAKQRVLESGPLAGWIVGSTESDFIVSDTESSTRIK